LPAYADLSLRTISCGRYAELYEQGRNEADDTEASQISSSGALIADDNGVSKAEQVIGKVERFYVLSRAALIP
jgi:hypothetical protein